VQVFLNISLHPLRNVQGHIDGVMDFTYDVSQQVRARQQVEQLNQELETRVQARTQELRDANAHLRRTNADLDTFVYTASHDLKSPITNLEGLLLALRDSLPVDVQQQPLIAPLLGLLDNTVSRFRLTIEQLTELIRLQQTPAGPAQPVLLGPLVAAVQEDLGAEATVAQAQVETAIPEGLSVRFAPANLRSIVYNLLSNAFKYRDPARPAQVRVHAERQPTAVVFTVQDNGLGLSESQQQRLFQAFQRLHTHVEGTGVGLYMIKRLIENAGATITVTSTPGVGSTFTIAFPTS
jgi:signal transduction histidine kinase